MTNSIVSGHILHDYSLRKSQIRQLIYTHLNNPILVDLFLQAMKLGGMVASE